MIKLGITGGIGSGKSTISEIFSMFDIPVYIADIESKRIVAESPIIKDKLISLFGDDLYKNSILDKVKLANLIFNDKAKLEIVNSIIHPEVKKDFEQWVEKNKQYPIVAQEAAILFESGFNKLMDKVVMVFAPLEMRIQRTMIRDKMPFEKVAERIKNQMPDEDKVKLSDFVIVNDGTISTIEQVSKIIHKLEKSCI